MKQFYFLTILLSVFVFNTHFSYASQKILSPYISSPSLDVPVTNLQTTITDSIAGIVKLQWDCTPSADFLHYVVKRDNVELATIVSLNEYFDTLLVFGEYNYCVEAIYSSGSTPASCSNQVWAAPQLVYNLAHPIATVWPAMNKVVAFPIVNTGTGILTYSFPDYIPMQPTGLLTYCAANATTSAEYISQVALSNLLMSSNWDGYSMTSNNPITLYKGRSYPIHVTISNYYSNDNTGVWIDFNKNGIFDASEYTALSGSNITTGTIVVPPDASSGYTTMRIRMQYGGTPQACGSTTYGEVEDYALLITDETYISDVVPASGVLLPGENIAINLNFSAMGSYGTTGVYHSNLIMETNDTANLSVSIPTTMIVGFGTYLSGVVSTGYPLEPLPGVLVQAGNYSATTNENGEYSMMVMGESTYDIVYSKLGFETIVSPSVFIAGNTTLIADTTILDYVASPPTNVHAVTDFLDTKSFFSWDPPICDYELLFDNCSGNNTVASENANTRYAVKFTPKAYPADVTGVKFFARPGTMLGSFSVMVSKPDASGMPGEVIDSINLPVTTYGWHTASGLQATIHSGDFFLEFAQLSPSPDSPKLGADIVAPFASKSYIKDTSISNSWTPAIDQDYMVHALMNGFLVNNDSAMFLSTHHYSVNRISGINPLDTTSIYYGGFLTLINNNLTNYHYSESGYIWLNLAMGYYAYDTEAVLYNGHCSNRVLSNIVTHKMFADITFNTQLGCGAASSAGAVVTLSRLYYPYFSITQTVPASGVLIFSHIPQGDMKIEVSYPGYTTYTQVVSLDSNMVVPVVLNQNLAKPETLTVNNTTLEASWKAPRAAVFSEDFESSDFASSGWRNQSQGIIGWHSSQSGNSANLPVPQHGKYALVNDELGGATNNGCCDYLITPILDLRSANDFQLSFSSYFNGLSSQKASVEISTDNGQSWNPIFICPAANSWMEHTVDLSAYCGTAAMDSVRIAFHADDAGVQASGWAIDDVVVSYGGMPVVGYKVFLNGQEVGQTVTPNYTFNADTLTSFQNYQAAVAAMYCMGESELTTTDFINNQLNSPYNLQADTIITPTSGAIMLTWAEPLSADSSLQYYQVYRDFTVLTVVPKTQLSYLDANLTPGTYCYYVTAVYDMTSIGFPGIFGESDSSNIVCRTIVYGKKLPFFEDFSSNSFNTENWLPGENWVVDSTSDNPVPAAQFYWEPLLVNYSSDLESCYFNVLNDSISMPHRFMLDFDSKLEDQLATGTEKLSIEINVGDDWTTLKEYSNTHDFDWLHESIDITAFALQSPFKLRFRAWGNSSDAIKYWSIDNVAIFVQIENAIPLTLIASTAPTATNDVLLNWNMPFDNKTVSDSTAPATLEGFKVYRRDYVSSQAGQNTSTSGIWQLIATVNETQYTDYNLSNLETNCYEYKVTALYSEGESVPSNIEWVCFFTGLKPAIINEIELFPNPANNFVSVKWKGVVSELNVFDSRGEMLLNLSVEGKQSTSIDTRKYPSGVYTLLFNTTKEGGIAKKFVISR